MKRLLIGLFSLSLVALSIISIIPASTTYARNVMVKAWRDRDMTYSFMQVLTTTSIRMRNILLTSRDGTQSFYREDLELKSGNFTAIPNTLRLEGTQQRPYVIRKVSSGTITVEDFSNADWYGIVPAFFNNFRNINIDDAGLDIKGVYLAMDEQFLYVMMTLHGPPRSYDPSPANYFFQARNLPEDDSFSFYTQAQPFPIVGSAFLNVHYRYKLTEPGPAVVPEAVTIRTYPSFVGYGDSSLPGAGLDEGFVEWKIPLADFPIEAIEGKYVDGWTGRPPSVPGRIDSTPSQQGVRIVVE